MTKARHASHGIARYLTRRRKSAHRGPAGASPDTLIAAADAQPSEVRVIRYEKDEITEFTPQSVAAMFEGRGKRWIDVRGLADLPMINELGEQLGLHPLIVADIVHTHQRPKVEVHDAYRRCRHAYAAPCPTM